MNNTLTILIFAFAILQGNNAPVDLSNTTEKKSSLNISSAIQVSLEDNLGYGEISDESIDLDSNLELIYFSQKFLPEKRVLLSKTTENQIHYNNLILYHLDLPPPCFL